MITGTTYIDGFFYLVLAYLLGSIPTSVWVGKLFYGIDVRNSGSGSAGATNTLRILGYKAAVPVLLFDAFKGWLPVYLGSISNLFQDNMTMGAFLVVVGLCAVVGHIFPLFAGFRGGKGVATLLGIALCLFSREVVVILALFLLVFLITRYVSLASITAAMSFPFVTYFIFDNRCLPYLIFAFIVALLVPLTHIKNIKRLLKGEEKKLKLRN
ncbi:MAG: Glycerol-3-phosphate acyltransferase [Bacteroidetes bacterium ADurb.Bin408]|nr:MAG: Glycerol-3-phosphate acyltransferase [Bacteroidetes bacterium ADurb.Bin408]